MKSYVLASAITRISGVKSIAADLDLGNGLNVASYQTAITELEELIDTHVTQVAQLGELKNRILEKEKVLRDFSERMLIGVGAKYGKDSNQYQMAGGTKKSLKKKPKRPAIPTPPAAAWFGKGHLKRWPFLNIFSLSTDNLKIKESL